MTRPIYRGQGNAIWPLESGALRRLERSYSLLNEEFLPTNEKELRKKIRDYQDTHLLKPLKVIDSGNQRDELRLAELQHHGAATMLLDFTKSPLVALWFACSKELDKKQNPLDGKVFAFDLGNPIGVWSNGQDEGWLKKPSQRHLYFEPDHSLSPRVAAQQSVFVVCDPYPPIQDGEIDIPASLKADILEEIKRLGVSEEVIFADLPGFAAQNKPSSPLPLSADPIKLRQAGERAFQKGDFDLALKYFDPFSRRVPEAAEPHWLKGNALAGLQEYERAIDSYTAAIALEDRPFADFPKSETIEDWFIDFRLATYRFNRANAHAALGSHEKAIEDFDETLAIIERVKEDSPPDYQDVHTLERNVRYNRANSKYVAGKFQEAFVEFGRAGGNARSETCLGMGNSSLMQGRFGDAIRHYSTGANTQMEKATITCDNNKSSVQKLIEICGEEVSGFEVVGNDLKLQLARDHGDQSFSIGGNQGNHGNWISGKGYDGLPGFAVRFV